jgi:hypothetical protein
MGQDEGTHEQKKLHLFARWSRSKAMKAQEHRVQTYTNCATDDEMLQSHSNETQRQRPPSVCEKKERGSGFFVRKMSERPPRTTKESPVNDVAQHNTPGELISGHPCLFNGLMKPPLSYWLGTAFKVKIISMPIAFLQPEFGWNHFSSGFIINVETWWPCSQR